MLPRVTTILIHCCHCHCCCGNCHHCWWRSMSLHSHWCCRNCHQPAASVVGGEISVAATRSRMVATIFLTSTPIGRNQPGIMWQKESGKCRVRLSVPMVQERIQEDGRGAEGQVHPFGCSTSTRTIFLAIQLHSWLFTRFIREFIPWGYEAMCRAALFLLMIT